MTKSEKSLVDSYRVALLRGGLPELQRVAMISLVERGLLAIRSARAVQTTPSGREARDLMDIDRLILARCVEPVHPTALHRAREFDEVVDRFEEEMRQLGLLPDRATKVRRWKAASAAIALTLLGGGTLIWRELASGGIDVEMTALATIWAIVMAFCFALLAWTPRSRALAREIPVPNAPEPLASPNQRLGFVPPGV